MRLVYVDEAGISKREEEPFLVVAAVIVDADRQLIAVERHLDKLVERHIPSEDREGFIFHAKEIFNGGGKVFKREKSNIVNPKWPLEKRLLIADDLAATLVKFNLPIAVGIVEKARFPHYADDVPAFNELNKGQQVVLAHTSAFMQCSMMVDHWMRQKFPNEICMLIAEDNEQARDAIRETHNIYQDRGLIREYSEKEKYHFPFRKIKEDPLFQKKRKSSVLQLADFCAYVFKKSMMKDEHYAPRFTVPIWKQLAGPLEAADKGRQRA